ncbi:MAG: DinB family protein [Gemmatimonadetes bacterium]|nr:DinB family protein [Gemmatimonadota bacterium]
MLAIVPEGKNSFRPDDKSRTLGELAGHIAELPGFAASILTTTEFDFAKSPWHTKQFTATSELLDAFDGNAAAFKAGIEAATWEGLDERWALRAGDHVIVKEQKAKLLRSIAISHIAHHRAQLGVYLRLLGLAVPGMYGPSADEM